jgi:hypothetical protein
MQLVAHYEERSDDTYGRDVHALVYKSKCSQDELYRALMVIVRAAQQNSVGRDEASKRVKRDEKLKRQAGCCFNLCCCCVGDSRCRLALLVAGVIMFVYRLVSQLAGYVK